MFNTELVTIKNDKEIIITLSNYEFNTFCHRVKKKWGTSRLFYLFDHHKIFTIFGRKNQLVINNFFLPDILYIFQNLPMTYLVKNIIKELLEKTWLKSLELDYNSRLDWNRLKDINENFKLKDYQEEAIRVYDIKKQKYQLDGKIFSLDMGLGKTFTSLVAMHLLKKDKVIIVAPNSTIREVWYNEIKKVFKDDKKIYVVNDSIIDADYYIYNYEALNKFIMVEEHFKNKNVGIIIDESHNFTNNDAKRVIEVKKIKDKVKSVDVLMLTGTPVKALGSDLLPTLSILDRMYTDEVGTIFKKSFGTNKPQALDVINNRLGLIMFRKLKSEVNLGLPEKIEDTIKVKIPNGNKFTLNNVKKIVEEFTKEREKYYEKNKQEYIDNYYMIMDIFKKSKKYDPVELKKYEDGVNYFRKHKYTSQIEFHRVLAKELNIYENNNIIPILPQQYKEQFRNSKTIVKYVHLKIMGEIIGGLLSKLRIEMINEMLKYSKIEEVIENSSKKTILFTTYVDVLKSSMKYLIEKKYTPVSVFGENTKDILHSLNEFKNNKKVNPLCATVQTLNSGVTLVEANTIIFLNPLYRAYIKDQASARIWRIGQNEDCYIFTLLLDTGNEENLSTRMEEIADWSKMMSSGIIDGEVVLEEYDSNIKEECELVFEDSMFNLLYKEEKVNQLVLPFHKFFIN